MGEGESASIRVKNVADGMDDAPLHAGRFAWAVKLGHYPAAPSTGRPAGYRDGEQREALSHGKILG